MLFERCDLKGNEIPWPYWGGIDFALVLESPMLSSAGLLGVYFMEKTTFPWGDSSGQTRVPNLARNASSLRPSAPMGSVLALEAAPGREINSNMGVPCQAPASSQESSLPLPAGLADVIITGNFFLSPAQEELQVTQPQ